MPDGLGVLNRSVGVDDSVFDPVLRLLPRCMAHGSSHAFAILWVDSFQERFARRWTLLRIESTNSEHFVGPVKCLLRRRVIGPTGRVGQPLRFRQISFAAPESLLCTFAFLDIGICPVPFDYPSVVVEGCSRTEQKPAVYSVETPQARFDFAWLA